MINCYDNNIDEYGNLINNRTKLFIRKVNEENEIELGFKTKKIARAFVKLTSQLSIIYREKFSLQREANVYETICLFYLRLYLR